MGRVHMKSVNKTTSPQTAPEAMGKLGSCFKCLLATIADSYDPEIPFLCDKLDAKDRFWYMVVSQQDTRNFLYMLLPEN